MDTHRKIVAAGVVTMLLMTGFVVIVNESGEDEEVDAITPEGWAFIGGFLTGIVVYHFILDPLFTDDNEDTAREGETNTVSTFLNTGVADYTQYLSQYAMMWPLTNEHWIRQAELMLRKTDKTVQEIMYDCGFHNKAYFYREFSRLHNCSPKDFRNGGVS